MGDAGALTGVLAVACAVVALLALALWQVAMAARRPPHPVPPTAAPPSPPATGQARAARQRRRQRRGPRSALLRRPWLSPGTADAVVDLVVEILGLRWVTAQHGEGAGQVVRGDQHLTGLGSLGRPDDLPRLQQVHQSTGLGEPDPELALQHGGG